MSEIKDVTIVRDGQTIIAEIKATVANVQMTALTVIRRFRLINNI